MLLFITYLWATMLLPTPPPSRTNGPRPHEPVAVIELFTSQGCSSCPPADRLLTETLQTARQRGQRVYGLSFHVDYWNRLGWRDPFSQHAFSERQQQYSRQFSLSSVYTPQAVLNGQREFVGSNRGQWNQLLPTALQTPAPVGVTLETPVLADGHLTVGYHLDGPLTNLVLNVAVVSKTTSTAVPRGENAGRTLTHDNVVRVFQTLPAASRGQVRLTLPGEYNPATGAVVAYVQLRRTGAVAGADARDLAN